MQNENSDFIEIANGFAYKRESYFTSLKRMADKADSIPDQKQLFGNYLLENNITLFPSSSGVGKTFLALNIAVAITNCFDTFLGEAINLHGHVLYVNYELSYRTLSKRAKKILSSIQASEKSFDCIIFNSRNSLHNDLGRICEKALQRNVVLIIIDNLNMANTSSDAMSSKDMLKLIYAIISISDLTKSAILLIDHTRKSDWGKAITSASAYGSSIKVNHVDSTMILMKSEKDKSLRLLKREKSRNVEEDDTVKLIRLESNMLFTLVEESVIEAEHIGLKSQKDPRINEDNILTLHAEGKSVRAIAGLVGVSKSTVDRIVKRHNV